MITCKLCRRVADESPTNGWCLFCHNNAAVRFLVADKQYPLTTYEQSKYTIKYMQMLARRIKRGAETAYCECLSLGPQSSSRGSQCKSFGDYGYQGHKVCCTHQRYLSEGRVYNFVGESDSQQDREHVYHLLATALEQARGDELRHIIARAMYDARNSKGQGVGSEAQGPSEGAGDGSLCQDAHVPWD